MEKAALRAPFYARVNFLRAHAKFAGQACIGGRCEPAATILRTTKMSCGFSTMSPVYVRYSRIANGYAEGSSRLRACHHLDLNQPVLIQAADLDRCFGGFVGEEFGVDLVHFAEEGEVGDKDVDLADVG